MIEEVIERRREQVPYTAKLCICVYYGLCYGIVVPSRAHTPFVFSTSHHIHSFARLRIFVPRSVLLRLLSVFPCQLAYPAFLLPRLQLCYDIRFLPYLCFLSVLEPVSTMLFQLLATLLYYYP